MHLACLVVSWIFRCERMAELQVKPEPQPSGVDKHNLFKVSKL